MYKVKLLNDISSKGTKLFPKSYTVCKDVENEDAIVLRSKDIHDYEFSDNLKAIARAGAGVNNIPVDKCSKLGIVVFNTPGANANAVKELVFAGLLLSSRGIFEGISWINKQKDNVNIASDAEKQKKNYVGNELLNKSIGIIGLGAIGRQVANLALEFGMRVYGYDPYISVSSAWELSRNVIYTESIEEIYKNCDYITLHIPLTDKTENMIDEFAINKMKAGVKVLNFSRSALVDSKAILAGINKGTISKYITDFPVVDLIGNKDVLILPHLGASTLESEENCAVYAVKELTEYLEKGNISNSVNLPDCAMELSGKMRICCIHDNVPKMITKIADVLGKTNINIENLLNKSKGNLAYTIIDIDNVVDETTVAQIERIPGIIRVNVFKHVD